MHGDDEADAEIGVDETTQRTDGIQTLGDDDAGANSLVRCKKLFFGAVQEIVFVRIAPVEVQAQAEQKDIQPVHKDGRPIRNELTQEGCGKGQGGHEEQKEQVQPMQVSIAFGDVLELHTLTAPKDPDGHEAQEVGQEFGCECAQSGDEIRLAVNETADRDFYIEDKQGECDGKNAIAECLHALHSLTCQ